MRVEWVDGFEIKAVVQNGEIVISANREGMLSLAKQLMALAVGELFRVVQFLVLVIFGEDDGCGIDTTCQTTAPGFIASCLYLTLIIMAC